MAAVRTTPDASARARTARAAWILLKSAAMWHGVLLFSALAWACAGSGSPGGAGQDLGAAGDAAGGHSAQEPTTVELGTPGGDDGLDFVPMSDGDELRLQTFGQGGTHVLLGVRCSGFGSRAFVSAELENITTGSVVEEPPPARPQLLYCEDGSTCELVPYLVHASGLTKTDAEKDGLNVRLTVRVHNEAGASGECSRRAVLSTADL